MREIKFRGRRSYDKQWLYGNLIIDERCNRHIIPNEEIEIDGHHLRIDSDQPVFVDEETVGQYTGLKDKNGKEIYEGDIVNIETDYFGEHKESITIVSWFDDIINDSFGAPYTCGYSIHGYNWEIIGNIHEHSHLLK